MTRLIDSGAGYGTFWLDLAEAFSSGKLEEFTIDCPSFKAATKVRFEFYAFRQDAKETYPELVVLVAHINKPTDGRDSWELTFSSRDKSESSELLQRALIKHGVLSQDDVASRRLAREVKEAEASEDGE